MTPGTITKLLLKYASISAAVVAALYATLLGLLTTSSFQAHVVYLHRIQMTWFQDLDAPETWGFLHNQATPFHIKSPSSPSAEPLYAWHILPLELYRQHEAALLAQPPGFALDFTSRLAFKLLRDDPDARLILHFHGAGGTVGSGHRPPNYRALSAGAPSKIHVLTFDYRGFGRSAGVPSEASMLADALSAVEWATTVAGIPASRILIFGQSLGTAVSVAVARHCALQAPPVTFAGVVLVAPFVDVPSLVATYSVAGMIPILGPLARFPTLFGYLSAYIRDRWASKERIAEYIRASEASRIPYRITLIHAMDDYDIPWRHTEVLFWHAVQATGEGGGIGYEELAEVKDQRRVERGEGGSVVEWRTEKGVIREEILKYGLHDVVMGYPVVTMAVMRVLEAADPEFR